MCFFTTGSRLKIALKDIECYKLVYIHPNSKICSLIQGFPYELNITYKKPWWKFFLHWITKLTITSEGYHSFTKIGNTVFGGRIVKCIIPRGSLYLHDEKEREYCSNAIKLVSLII